MSSKSMSYGSVGRNKTKSEMRDDFYSDKSSTFERLKERIVPSENNTSSFNSTADSGNSLVTVIENKRLIVQSDMDITGTLKKKESRRSVKKRNSSANSMSSISKSGSTSRSRSNNSRTITISSHNCSSHSCSGSYSTSSSPCSGSFSSSYSSSRSSSVRSQRVNDEAAEIVTEVGNSGNDEEQIISSTIDIPREINQHDSESQKAVEESKSELEIKDGVPVSNSYGENNSESAEPAPSTIETMDEGTNDNAPIHESNQEQQDIEGIEMKSRSNSTSGLCCACCRCCSAHYPPEIVVFIAPGSFNPVTIMHMRMLELARDAIERTWALNNPKDDTENDLHRYTKRTRDDVTIEEKPDQKSLIIPRRQIVAAGIYSPVSNSYNYNGNLEPASSRKRLLRLACASASDWIAVDDWESSQEAWTPTKDVMDHFLKRIDRITFDIWKRFVESADTDDLKDSNGLPGVATDKWITHRLYESIKSYYNWIQKFSRFKDFSNGSSCDCFCCSQNKFESMDHDGKENTRHVNELLNECPKIRLKMVCGSDLLQSMVQTDLWNRHDIHSIFTDYGVVCIERFGTDDMALHKTGYLSKYEQNIIMARELNDEGLNATLVHRALSKGYSVRYLIPDAALEEIYASGLYGAKQRSLSNLPEIENLFKLLNRTHSKNSPMDNQPQHIDLSDGCRWREVYLKTSSKTGSSVCIPVTIQIGSLHDSTSMSQSERSSKSVQTKLTALSHQLAPLVLTKISNEKKADKPEPFQSYSAHSTLDRHSNIEEDFDEKTLFKHIDPQSQHHLSAILPLVRQCHRCGSQKVRLILVERPQFPIFSKKDDAQTETDAKEMEKNQVSKQTDNLPTKKCLNKKTQYPSISSRQRAELQEQLVNKTQILKNRIDVQDVENYSDFRSRRPPPPVPKETEIGTNFEVEQEKKAPIIDDPSMVSVPESDRDAPKQELLDDLISPSSIYALISDQKMRFSETYQTQSTNEIFTPEVDTADSLVLKNRDENIPLLDQHSVSHTKAQFGTKETSLDSKQKLCKHKRHHFHAKRESTIQSSDLNDHRMVTNREFLGNFDDSSYPQIESHRTTHEKCSKHQQKEKKKKRISEKEKAESISRSMEHGMRKSRTLPKNSTSEVIQIDETPIYQIPSHRMIEESVFGQGRGRSIPSFTSKMTKGPIGSRQNTLTDDSLAELLNEYENNDIIRTIPRQTPKHSHKHHSCQHHHTHDGRRRQYNKSRREQFISSDDVDEGDVTETSKNSKVLSSFGDGTQSIAPVIKPRHPSSKDSKHTMDRKKLKEQILTEKEILNMLSPKGSMKMSLRNRPLLDSDFSFQMDREAAYLSQINNRKSARTPEKASISDFKMIQNSDTIKTHSSSGHKCSRHSKVGSGHSDVPHQHSHRHQHHQKMESVSPGRVKAQYHSRSRVGDPEKASIHQELYDERTMMQQLKQSKRTSRKKT